MTIDYSVVRMMQVDRERRPPVERSPRSKRTRARRVALRPAAAR